LSTSPKPRTFASIALVPMVRATDSPAHAEPRSMPGLTWTSDRKPLQEMFHRY
jgi:hypothetical protein